MGYLIEVNYCSFLMIQTDQEIKNLKWPHEFVADGTFIL